MKIVKNYLYNIVYQVFILILPFITVPYISRVLGPDGVGINAYTGSIVNYFVLFASLGINIYGNREIAYTRDDQKLMSSIFWEILSLKVIIVSIVYLIFMLFVFFYGGEYTPYYLCQSISLLSVALDISWLYMGIEDLKKTVLRNTLVKIISLILIFTLVKSSDDLILYILILTLSTFFGNLILFLSLKKVLVRPKFNWHRMWKHFKGSVVLFIPQMSIALYLDLNKTMLGFYKGPVDVGYFENANKVISMTTAMLTATKSVITPRIANLVVKNKIQKIKYIVYTLFKMLNGLAIPAVIGLIIIAKPFAILFFGQKFVMSGYVLMCLAPSLLFIAWSTSLGQQYLIPLNRMKEYNISIIVTAIINIGLNILIIKPFGLFGATIITVLAEFIVAICQMILLRNEFQIRSLFGDTLKYIIAAIAMAIVVLIINHIFTFNAIVLCVDGVVGLATYLFVAIKLKVSIFNELKEILKL